MASRSPAGSPPAPSPANLPNPRKRPSLTGPAGPGAKRRKASIYSASGSAHPLRQTSFPPEDSALYGSGLRSPSVETDITQSVAASGISTSKRGRKRKSNAAADTTSVRSGPSTKGGTPGQGGRGDTASRVALGQDENDAPEEDDDDEGLVGDADVDVAGRAMEEEKARYSALFEAADEIQQDRLTNFRRFHLSEGKVRRIVNQTLSQSVPKSVITAVNSYTKYFIGFIIERAIEIQRHDDLAAIGALVPSLPLPIQEDEESNEQSKDSPAVKGEGASATPSTDMGESSEGKNEVKQGSATQTGGTPPVMNGAARPNGNSLAPAPINTNLSPSPRNFSSPATPISATSKSMPKEGDEDAIQKRQHAIGKEIMIGPLRPDSVREAIRRLKKEGEFGGVGMEGISTGMGIQGGRASMMSGRRLFR